MWLGCLALAVLRTIVLPDDTAGLREKPWGERNPGLFTDQREDQCE
jgi:hypothetical protein